MDEFTAGAIDSHLERIAVSLEALVALYHDQRDGPLRERYHLLNARAKAAASRFTTLDNRVAYERQHGRHPSDVLARRDAAEEESIRAGDEFDAFCAAYPDLELGIVAMKT